MPDHATGIGIEATSSFVSRWNRKVSYPLTQFIDRETRLALKGDKSRQSW
jgi:hypothetical protein